MRDELKAEAITRLEFLKEKYDLIPTVVNEFKKDGTLYYSDMNMGILFWVSNKEEMTKFVEDFEKEHDAMVYHIIHDNTTFGELYTVFYVSNYKEEWEMDEEDLEQGMCLAYVHNISDPDCSEFGNICFKGMNGGLIRTA